MISHKRLEEQLKRINFYYKGWGRSEVEELCNIIMPDEEIEECVNGYYEAGFALLVATKDRLLLVDKKPLGYLTVEDMRFDMINEFDLHHRLLGAQIKVSAGSKTLHFTSLNQARLRRLLNFVQARMTQIKKDTSQQQDAQKQHLEEMNEQLRLYLMAAHKQQFVDQAQAIRQPGQGLMLPEVQAPAAAFYSQQAPTAWVQPQPADVVSAANQVEPADTLMQPASPFEQAALAAFEAQNGSQPALNVTETAEKHSKNHEVTHHKSAEQGIITPQQIGLGAARRVLPIITAYTKLPSMKRPVQNTTKNIRAEAT
jgi:hypothetical protein